MVDCRVVVAVYSAVSVAVLQVALHVNGQQALGAFARGDAIVEGPLVGGGITGERLPADQLARQARCQPLVIADEEHSAARVSHVARLAARVDIAIRAGLADALEALARHPVADGRVRLMAGQRRAQAKGQQARRGVQAGRRL